MDDGELPGSPAAPGSAAPRTAPALNAFEIAFDGRLSAGRK
ncbi:hypothetical protein ACNTMW_32820 [Planosporangium sp. 12N6]